MVRKSMGGMHIVSPSGNFRCVGNLSSATVYFSENQPILCEISRSFTWCGFDFPHNGQFSRKIDFPETFARRFPNFEDINLWPEDKFLSSPRRIEWCADCPDRTILRRDTFFGYAKSSTIPTFKVQLWQSAWCASLSAHMGLSFQAISFLACSSPFPRYLILVRERLLCHR